MNLSTMILSPIAGGLIGYFTNWLAIKMLFRPHNEVYFLGVKLPFTPGLIPKERYKLADKVSEAISEHLLTKEVIVENLISDQVIEQIGLRLDIFTHKLALDKRTVKDYMEILFKESNVLGSIEFEILNALGNQFSEENIRRIAEYIAKGMGEFLENYPIREEAEKAAEQAGLYEKYEEFIIKNIQNILLGLQNEEKTIRELVSVNSIIAIKAFANDKIPMIAPFIQDLLENNSTLDENLENLVGKIIEDSIGRIASMFLDKGKIYENIKTGLISYLSEPDNQVELGLKLSGVLDKLMDKPIKDFEIPEEYIEGMSDKVLELCQRGYSKKIYDKLWDTVFNLVEKTQIYIPRIEEKAEEFLFEKISFWVGENREKICKKISSFIMDYILNLRADKILSEILKKEREHILNWVKPLAEKVAVYASEILDVGKIAKDQINGMDLEQGEELVLSVVHRELRAITLVGGVLGFIIGFMPVILEFVL